MVCVEDNAIDVVALDYNLVGELLLLSHFQKALKPFPPKPQNKTLDKGFACDPLSEPIRVLYLSD